MNESLATTEDFPLGHLNVPKYGIYIANLGSHGQRFAVRESDNPRGAGDLLFIHAEQAKAYVAEAKARDASNAEYRARVAQQASERQATLAREKAEREDTDGYADTLPPLQRGKAIDALNKYVNYNGKEMTIKAMVRAKVADSSVKLQAIEEDRIKPLSRKQFNRATNEEQQAHERRIKAGGKKIVYLIGMLDLGKIAYDYALHLRAKQVLGQ